MLEDLQKMGRKRLGGILMSEGLVTPEQVTEALEIQKDTKKMLGQVLVELGYITEYDLAKSLATQFQFPYINPVSYQVERPVLDLLPVEMLYKYVFVPLDRFGNLLIVAMAGILPENVVQEIKKQTGCDLRIYISTARDVKNLLERELPIDPKLRKEIEGPAIAPLAAQAKKKKVQAKKAGATPPQKKPAAPAPQPEPEPELSGLGILDQADEMITKERKTQKRQAPAPQQKPQPKPQPEAEPVEEVADLAAALGGGDGDVDWQGLFDEVDKSIREEIQKKKTVDGEEEGIDFDFD